MKLHLNPIPAPLTAWSPLVWLVTWGHSGRVAPASGTWGTLAALPFVIYIRYLGGGLSLIGFALVCFLAGLYAIPRYTAYTENKDPPEIVLDEVAGIALTFIAAPHLDILTILFGFTLFRALDALKPGPIGWCDRKLKGGMGVMMDDIVAGIVASLCVYGLQQII
ncbi:MAG TPA: phosphatidylglycerophosphatase A [Alphaproteobacteria bacterium]